MPTPTDAQRIERLQQTIAVLEEQCYRAWFHRLDGAIREAAERYARQHGLAPQPRKD